MVDWLANNVVNIVVFLFVVLVVGLALRATIKGHMLDCSSCGGDCSGCGGVCKNPQLKLSREQLSQLDELDRKYGVPR